MGWTCLSYVFCINFGILPSTDFFLFKYLLIAILVQMSSDFRMKSLVKRYPDILLYRCGEDAAVCSGGKADP